VVSFFKIDPNRKRISATTDPVFDAGFMQNQQPAYRGRATHGRTWSDAQRIGTKEGIVAIAQPKYDVALSFLSTDKPTAAALRDRLSEGLEVFFFPRKQEELAGTDGLESMRIPFLKDSRILVVLYREPWGKTPWTGVEQTAIEESCLNNGWHRLFFIVLDKTSTLPIWLPLTHVRFNYADFGLEQAVGAIKARVQESGGVLDRSLP
jgi:hypothetical protein